MVKHWFCSFYGAAITGYLSVIEVEGHECIMLELGWYHEHIRP